MIVYEFFFLNDTATTEIYTLSLHDALPISGRGPGLEVVQAHLPADGQDVEHPHPVDVELRQVGRHELLEAAGDGHLLEAPRSEEHTSELQSRQYLVCRLLLEKKITTHITI